MTIKKTTSNTNFFTDASADRMYPVLKIDYVKNPNRFYAFPILGAVVKFIMLIPIGIEIVVLAIVFGVLSIINSFIVLFTGDYWDTAYNFTLGFMRLTTKAFAFLSGLTNSYPGFDFTLPKEITLNMPKPQHPNRLFAIPILGFLIRIILLIPYNVWNQILSESSGIGIFVSFAPVLFAGRYPESTYELARDQVRVSLGSLCYLSGLSDNYPSFWISMNHKNVKIILIILGALVLLNNLSGNFGGSKQQHQIQNKPGNYTMPTR